MNTNKPPLHFDSVSDSATGDIAKNFVANVFSWMTIGLLLTAFVAGYSASSGLYLQLVGSGGLMSWVILLAPFAFIIAMNAGLQKYSDNSYRIVSCIFCNNGNIVRFSFSDLFYRVYNTSIRDYSGNVWCHGFCGLHNDHGPQ